MKTKQTFILLLVLMVVLQSCADGQPVECVTGHTYGFWGGLWHGLICWFDFVGMLIWDDVAVYAPNNNGGWYAFGFVLGAAGLPFTFKSVKTTRK